MFESWFKHNEILTRAGQCLEFLGSWEISTWDLKKKCFGNNETQCFQNALGSHDLWQLLSEDTLVSFTIAIRWWAPVNLTWIISAAAGDSRVYKVPGAQQCGLPQGQTPQGFQTSGPAGSPGCLIPAAWGASYPESQSAWGAHQPGSSAQARSLEVLGVLIKVRAFRASRLPTAALGAWKL